MRYVEILVWKNDDVHCFFVPKIMTVLFVLHFPLYFSLSCPTWGYNLELSLVIVLQFASLEIIFLQHFKIQAILKLSAGSARNITFDEKWQIPVILSCIIVLLTNV